MSSNGMRLRSRGTTFSYTQKVGSGRISLGAFRDKVTGSNLTGSWESWEQGPLYNAQSYQPLSFQSSSELTLDEIHKGPIKQREGGPFKSYKASIATELSSGVLGKGIYRNKFNTRRYEGGFIPPTFSGLFGISFDSLTNYYRTAMNSDLFPDIDDWGNRGWRKTKPKIESAGLYVFLREASDIPRMLKTTKDLAKDLKNTWEGVRGKYVRAVEGPGVLTRTNERGWVQTPKRASDQFINEEFGWKPFINDILQFSDVYQNGRQIVQRLIDQNGQYVRRRVPLGSETKVTLVEQGSFPGTPIDGYSLNISSISGIEFGLFPVVFPGDFFVAPPTYKVFDEVKTSRHAVGKFKFYNPIFNISYVTPAASAWRTVERYLAIYGLRVTPSNVYKAIPWTWLIDWFVDVSRYIDAISDSLVDQVVCDYFFVSMRQEYKRTLSVSLPFVDGTVNLSYDFNINTKERKGASSPFDFALGMGSLSSRQLAILSALKVSRTRRTLRG